MTSLLINLTAPGGNFAPGAHGAAPAILDAEGAGSVLRFGETLREHESEDSAQEGELSGGELLGPDEATVDLQIDDADILKQLNVRNAAATGPATADVVDEVFSDRPETASEEGEHRIEMAPLPATPMPAIPAAAAEVARGASPVRDENAAVRTIATHFAVEDSSGGAKAAIPLQQQPSVSAPRAADAAVLAMSAASGASATEQQTSNVLASQSQSLLMALANGPADAAGQKTAVAAPVAESQAPATANRQALVEALGERLSVQLNRGSSQATIRLDPPMMGTIEIVIRQDAAGVQVHLTASHGDVLRQLHNIGNALTQDLVQRNHGDVTVHVSDSSRDTEGRNRQRQNGSGHGDSTPGHALRMTEESDRAVAFTLA